MYELSRIRLKSVGPAGARFHDVLLDLSGAGAPVEYQQASLLRPEAALLRPSPASLVLLENGGGKSVLLKLIFSVLLPGRRQILGTSNTRILDNFVLAKDIAHIVLEWTDARTGRRLLTGKVMAWRNRVASASADSLQERWYCLRPGDSLTLDTLPFTLDGQSLLLETYKDELHDAHAADQSLELTWFRHQGDWTERLQQLSIDSELFRYQREMNVDEGEAVGALQLDSDIKFVEFLLRIVYKAGDLDELAALVTEHVERLAKRGALLMERAFIDGTLRLLTPVIDAAAALDTSRRRGDEAHAAFTRLATQIHTRAQAEHAALDNLTSRAHHNRAQQQQAAEHLSHCTNVEHELKRLLAQMRLEQAAARLTAREQELAQARALVEAWGAAPLVHEHDDVHARVQALNDLVEAQEEKARPALTARDSAARSLARALWAGADAAFTVEQDERALAATHAAKYEEARQQVNTAINAAATSTAEANQLHERISDVHTQTNNAIADGILADAATLARTLADARDEGATAGNRIGALERERDELADLESQAQQDLSRAQQEAAERKAAKDEAQAKLDEARTETTALQTEPRLVELLETDHIDLEHDTIPLLARLTESLGETQREQTELQMAQSTDEQARLALASGGLLPPPPAVTEACKALKDAGITAFSGWRYLEGIPDPQRRHELVNRIPHLAAGILINNPQDMNKAQSLLATLRPQPTVFVAVATTRTFNESDTSQAPGTDSALPLHPALYDPQAAAAEHEQIEARHTERAQRLQVLADRSQTDTMLIHRINDWRRRHPEGHLTVLHETCANLVHRHAAAEEIVEEHRTALLRFPTRRAEIATELPPLRDRKEALAERVRRLAELDQQHQRLPAWQKQATAAVEAAALHQLTAVAAEERAKQLQDKASQHERNADEAVRTLRTLNDERAKLPGTEDVQLSDPVPALSIALLRSVYDTARDTYLRVAVGSDLLEEKRHTDEHASKINSRYTRLDPAVRTQARQLLKLPQGSDEAARAAALDSADRSLKTKEKAKENAVIDKALCERALEQATELVTVPVELAEPPQDIGGCVKGIELAEAERIAAQEEHTKRSAAHAEAQRILEVARKAADDFQLIAENLAVDTSVTAPEHEAAPAYAGDAASARTVLRELTQTKTSALGQLRKDEDTLQEAVTCLSAHATAQEFKDLHIPIQNQIRVTGWQTTAAQAPEWSDRLRPRLRALNEEIEQASRHRDLIVENLRGHVVKALRILRQAQHVSRLPGSLDDWADEEFLRFFFKQADEASLTARLGEVIDDAATGRAADGRTVKRDGISLLLHGVRAAVPNGFRVDMLKPDPVLRAERVRVADIKDIFSGGQALTAAILLYCTMAALRANDRGRVRDSYAGVLFLDNPIGRANADYLIDLQRKVAEALGVQLIYTTGLSDDRTLKRFPLVLRLRNDADLRTGRKYLTVAERIQEQLDQLDEPDGSGRLTSTRLFRSTAHGEDTDEASGE